MRYQQLILEKAAIERQIRAFRVVRIRKAFIERKTGSALYAELEKMEDLIASVFYVDQELDYTIDKLEVQLDLDLEDM